MKPPSCGKRCNNLLRVEYSNGDTGRFRPGAHRQKTCQFHDLFPMTYYP